MMCLLNVYNLVCNLAAECKKDGCKKRLAYTLSLILPRMNLTLIKKETLLWSILCLLIPDMKKWQYSHDNSIPGVRMFEKCWVPSFQS